MQPLAELEHLDRMQPLAELKKLEHLDQRLQLAIMLDLKKRVMHFDFILVGQLLSLLATS